MLTSLKILIKTSACQFSGQLLNFIPSETFKEVVNDEKSDRYYKKLKTWNAFVFMLYGKLMALIYFSITELPARSIFADANRNRKSDVIGKLYSLFVEHYKNQLSGSYWSGLIDKKIDMKRVKIFDSTTFTLFVGVFTGVGRNKIEGKKKGGIKAHVLLFLHSLIPEIVWMIAASKNYKDFFG